MKLSKIATSEHWQVKWKPFPACLSTNSSASACSSSKQTNTGLTEKDKSTKHFILLRWRGALHGHRAPCDCIVPRAHSPAWLRPDQAVGSRSAFPLGAAPCEAAYPQSAGWNPPALAQGRQYVAITCTKSSCQAVKFCKPFLHTTPISLSTAKQQITWSRHPAANEICSLYSLQESRVTFL